MRSEHKVIIVITLLLFTLLMSLIGSVFMSHERDTQKIAYLVMNGISPQDARYATKGVYSSNEEALNIINALNKTKSEYTPENKSNNDNSIGDTK